MENHFWNCFSKIFFIPQLHIFQIFSYHLKNADFSEIVCHNILLGKEN